LRLEEGRRKGAPATQPGVCRTPSDLHHLPRRLVTVPRTAVFAAPSARRGGSSIRCSCPAVSQYQTRISAS